jgi:gamma-glutamyltranspeptidase/glutathione hydrolase
MSSRTVLWAWSDKMSGKRYGGAEEAFGERYAVASGCAEASRAAADVLASGGSVVDAAIAGSAVLCVVLPHATSLGGDLFALVKLGDGPVVAVNATGAAPAAATIEAYRERGCRTVPEMGGLAVQGPGLVAGWQALHDRWGKKPLPELLRPAIELARSGSTVGWRLAGAIAKYRQRFSDLPGWKDLFVPGGRPLGEGERFVQRQLAGTLERIAAEGARGFYVGPVARDIARTVAAAGGFLNEADLATIRAEVAPPLTAHYRGLEICTQPPISQGLVLLRALRLLEDRVPDPRAIGMEAFWGLAAACLRRAFDERLALMADSSDACSLAEAIIAGKIDASVRPKSPVAGVGDNTSTLSAMDARGNAVALIQSVYTELGSGVVGVESGVLLNSRLIGFFLDPKQANALAPRRRTMHTLHSCMVFDAGGLRWAGGSPGGDNQPQANLQVLTRLQDFGEEPAQAVAAPRWCITPGTKPGDILGATGNGVDCEAGVPSRTRAALADAGFTVSENEKVRVGSSKFVGRGTKAHTVGAWADWRREGAVAAG